MIFLSSILKLLLVQLFSLKTPIEARLHAPLTVPDIVHCCYVLLFLVTVVIGVLYLTFSAISSTKFIIAGALIVTWVSLYLAVSGLQKFVEYMHRIRGTNQWKQCKNNLLIGSGAGLVLGWVPRIFVLIVTYDQPWVVDAYHSRDLWCVLLIVLPTICLFWCGFVANFKEKCEILYRKDEKLPWIIVAINSILLIISLRVAMCYEQLDHRKAILSVQIAFSGVCTASMIDFCQILNGKIQMVREELSQECPEEKVGIENPVIFETGKRREEIEQRLDCKACNRDYTDIKIPRILKDCGHTVCETCADALLKKNNEQYLFRPFCEKVTVVNGKANLLPKNFSICEMLEEKKKTQPFVIYK